MHAVKTIGRLAGIGLIAGRNRLIDYVCKDIGYGAEEGSMLGRWTGEIDCWGKLTIKSATSGPDRYLFPDEIVDVGPIPERYATIARLNRYYNRLFKRVGFGWDMPTLKCCEPGVYNSFRRLKDIALPYRDGN